MQFLLIPLMIAGVFAFPFAMAWLEPDRDRAPRRVTQIRPPRG